MIISTEQRPYFCTRTFPHEDTGNSSSMKAIPFYFENATREPWKAAEFEVAIECVLRNNGFDPNKKMGWDVAGITKGHEWAVDTMKQAYLSAVPISLLDLKADAQQNPYDYTPSAIQSENHLIPLVKSFKRGHLGQDDSYLLSDEAWQEAGVTSAAAFHETVRTIFKDARVGGYVAHELNIDDVDQIEELSVKAADYAIQNAFPELATKLGIPATIKLQVAPKATMAASAFGKANDCQPY